MEKNPKQTYRQMAVAAWQAARKAVASPGARRYRTWLFQLYVLAALIVFAVLAFFANTTPYFRVDLLFTRELQTEAPGWFGYILQWVSWPGYGIQSISILALVTIFLAVVGLRWEAVAALFAGVSSGALNYLIKIVIRRPRPGADLVNVFSNLNSYSFPSGHVMFYTAFFGFLLFLGFVLLKHNWKRSLLLIFLLLLIVLVGPSRMYLGEHWASDVLAGYLMGSLTLAASIWFYHWGKQRFQTDQPVAPTPTPVKLTGEPIPVTSQEAKKEAQENHDDDPDRPAAGKHSD